MEFYIQCYYCALLGHCTRLIDEAMNRELSGNYTLLGKGECEDFIGRCI